jgi:hypothetical protein
LVELNHRAYFNKEEDIKIMREVDKKGDFAPAGPEIKKLEEGQKAH